MWVLKKPRLGFRTKVALITGFAMLLVTATSSLSIYRVAMHEATHELGQRLMAIAISGALDIDGDAHARLLKGPYQSYSPTYRKIQAYLRELRDRNKNLRIRFIYTMVPTSQPGFWRYGVDAEPEDSKDFSPLGRVEDFRYDPSMRVALAHPIADEYVRYYGEWGWLLSASAPIKNSSGRSVGILSLDSEPDAIMAALLNFREWAIGIALVGLMISVGLSFPLAWQVTRPISALIQGTKAVARGDFNYRVTIPNRDELGDLAQAFNAMTAGLRERGLYKQQLERYVSPQVAQKILSKPEKIFWAERKKVTVLFCDIRGFTSLAERLGAEQVVRRLNEFFYEMIDILFQYEGTLDKFIGDAIMALFGAPLSSGHDEEQAVSAAVAMQERTDRLNRDWVRQGFEGFRIGIAICTGEVVVGNIGSERRMEYSAIGDAVNMAWRLEELNKRYNTRILLSESTYQAVSDKVEVRPLGSEILRGRKEPVHIYELAGLKTSLITPS